MIKLLTILSFFANIINPDDKIIEHAKYVKYKYNAPKKDYIVVIDYSKSIDSTRLYVVDMKQNKIILKSIVAHGVFSGNNIPYEFSNEFNTKKSSLGTYITKHTYYGKFGYSLVVKGLDKTNSNAEKRNIIFHSSKLMSTKWSWGCFATPESINMKLINLIKDGCLVSVQKL